MRILILPVAILFMCGCAARKTATTLGEAMQEVVKVDGCYFGGWLIYADTPGCAAFADCATGVIYPLCESPEYRRMMRTIPSGKIVGDQAIFIEFTGDLESFTADYNSPYNSLGLGVRMQKFVAFDRYDKCYGQFVVPGIYENMQDGRKTILRLKPDYSFTVEMFDLEGMEEVVYSEALQNGTAGFMDGCWRMSSRYELVLDCPSTKKQRRNTYTVSLAESFRLMPEFETLDEIVDGQGRVFRKVYLR